MRAKSDFIHRYDYVAIWIHHIQVAVSNTYDSVEEAEAGDLTSEEDDVTSEASCIVGTLCKLSGKLGKQSKAQLRYDTTTMAGYIQSPQTPKTCDD